MDGVELTVNATPSTVYRPPSTVYRVPFQWKREAGRTGADRPQIGICVAKEDFYVHAGLETLKPVGWKAPGQAGLCPERVANIASPLQFAGMAEVWIIGNSDKSLIAPGNWYFDENAHREGEILVFA